MRSIARTLGTLALASFTALGIAGCMEPQTTTPQRSPSVFSGGYTTQVLNTADYNAAFAAAQGVVADHFEIAGADPTVGVIEFAPKEHTRLGGARVRRVGRLALHKVGTTVVASARVEIQKYATPNIRALSQQFSGDDRPNITPIQEEAGLTPAQQEYWNPERRDTALEAQILRQLQEVIAQLPQTPAGSEPTATEATTSSPAGVVTTPAPATAPATTPLEPNTGTGGVIQPFPV